MTQLAAPPPPVDGDLRDCPVGGCGHVRPCPWHESCGGPLRVFDPRKTGREEPAMTMTKAEPDELAKILMSDVLPGTHMTSLP
jgi:hypothetical protein